MVDSYGHRERDPLLLQTFTIWRYHGDLFNLKYYPLIDLFPGYIQKTNQAHRQMLRLHFHFPLKTRQGIIHKISLIQVADCKSDGNSEPHNHEFQRYIYISYLASVEYVSILSGCRGLIHRAGVSLQPRSSSSL